MDEGVLVSELLCGMVFMKWCFFVWNWFIVVFGYVIVVVEVGWCSGLFNMVGYVVMFGCLLGVVLGLVILVILVGCYCLLCEYDV